jgi:hypothetical protein
MAARRPFTTRRTTAAAALALAVGATLVAGPASASGAHGGGDGRGGGGGDRAAGQSFERIASFPVFENNADPTTETVAEIVDATEDGRTLVYTDALQGVVGFVDIRRPDRPRPGGTVDVGGSPTSVAVTSRYALVGVDTSPSFTAPAGHLAVIDLRTHAIVATVDLGGQPDSVKLSPDGRYLAVVMENQRDEDVTVDGVEGGLPQAPPGLLKVVDLRGRGPSAWTVRDVDLTGLSEYAPDDPEPEFVDVDGRNRAVVTLQENNHIAVVDLVRARVVADFPAGSVDLEGVDTEEDGLIDLSGSLADVPREPDGVTWLPDGSLATANEGDLFGGSRGFTFFSTGGDVTFDSGNSVEHLAVRYGHYPESRSDAKGTEPEGIDHARFGDDDLLFVGSERGNFIAVYDLVSAGRGGRHGGRGPLTPEFSQLLPTGMGPEGMVAIPDRDLLVVTSETDDPPTGVRTVISIYQRVGGEGSIPQVVSVDGPDGTPIPWSALSALAPDPRDPDTLHAVWDSYYAESRIVTLDVGDRPAVMRASLPITGGSGGYDPEGLALAPDGTWWVASEGNASGSVPNQLLQVDASGAVLAEIGLPAEVIACRAASANRGSLGAGFEGVTVVPAAGGGYTLAVAQQRGWDYTTPGCEDLDDDPTGANAGEPGSTRVWTYDPATGAWGHVPYELQPVPPNAAWVGLSEIVALRDGSFGLIERDNLTGDFSQIKWLTQVDLSGPVTRGDKRTFDLLPVMRAGDGWITDKPEGFTVAADGTAWVVTDNDGVEDWTGETQLLDLGPVRRLFR